MKITSRQGGNSREGEKGERREEWERREERRSEGRGEFISFRESWLIKHGLSTHSDFEHDHVTFCSCALLIGMFLFIIFSPLEKNFVNTIEKR